MLDPEEDLFVRIVPPSEGIDPAFTISENGGPQQVCVQLVDQTGGVPVLSSPATVSLSTADGNAQSMSCTYYLLFLLPTPSLPILLLPLSFSFLPSSHTFISELWCLSPPQALGHSLTSLVNSSPSQFSHHKYLSNSVSTFLSLIIISPKTLNPSPSSLPV